jgi:hypothetical protein
MIWKNLKTEEVYSVQVINTLQTNQGSSSFTKLVPLSHNPWHHIPEVDVHSYNCDDLKSYMKIRLFISLQIFIVTLQTEI